MQDVNTPQPLRPPLLSQYGQTEAHARQVVLGLDSRYQSGGAVNLMKMSNALTLEDFREYIAASRHLRRAVKLGTGKCS